MYAIKDRKKGGNAPASLLPSLKKQRSGSACSARGHITAFGLYCPLSGQAFVVAFLLGHNNSQRHSVRNADFFDFLFKILQFKSDGYSTITQRTEKP